MCVYINIVLNIHFKAYLYLMWIRLELYRKLSWYDNLNHKKSLELDNLKTKTEQDLWTADFEEIENILEPKKKIKFKTK